MYSIKSHSFAALTLPDVLAAAVIDSATKDISMDRSSSRSSSDASIKRRVHRDIRQWPRSMYCCLQVWLRLRHGGSGPFLLRSRLEGRRGGGRQDIMVDDG
mmetsp:Transcript_11296/g.21332  ORF Transcript_11296/g.21332 Transcript_11296/m.21332 type:complete len:101 (+) Transcript_11296:1994-2296(+)